MGFISWWGNVNTLFCYSLNNFYIYGMLRSVPTLGSDGSPLTIVLQTRAEISFSNSAVSLLALNDDGEKIQAAIQYANGSQATVTLFEGVYYQPIADFTDEEIDERIVEVLQ